MDYNFPYIGNKFIPFDFHIFQRGGSTTNQLGFGMCVPTPNSPAFNLAGSVLLKTRGLESMTASSKVAGWKIY